MTIIVPFCFLLACQSTDTKENTLNITEKFLYQDSTKAFDVRLKDYFKNAIGIEEGEDYSTRIFEEHLNDDNVKEVIITVNRKDFAFKQAIKNNFVDKASSIDYFGNYNYLVIYNSKKKQFYAPIIIASSAYKPVDLTFENMGPYSHKDIILDYTIGDARFRKYFLFDNPNGKINYAFKWIVFEDWNKGATQASCFEHTTGSRSTFKDIIVKNAKLLPLADGEDYNLVDAKIECQDVIQKRFFFNLKDGKYYTED